MQRRVKSLQSARDGRYRMLHKTDEARSGDMEREKEKLQALWSVAQKLQEDAPEGILNQKLGSLSNIIKSKMQSLQAQP